MGFFDEVQNTINRGTAAVGRGTRSTQLKMQLNDLAKQRRDLAAQLGASLYNDTKDNEELRVGREPLFDAIAAIDNQRASVEAEIASIEAQTQEAQSNPTSYKCPKCGLTVGANDLFCSGCGTPIDEIKAAYPEPAPVVAQPVVTGPTCPQCGAAISPNDTFCMSCGAKIEPPATPVA